MHVNHNHNLSLDVFLLATGGGAASPLISSEVRGHPRRTSFDAPPREPHESKPSRESLQNFYSFRNESAMGVGAPGGVKLAVPRAVVSS